MRYNPLFSQLILMELLYTLYIKEVSSDLIKEETKIAAVTAFLLAMGGA